MDLKLLKELADFLNFEFNDTLPDELVAKAPFWVAAYLEDPMGAEALKGEMEEYLLPVVLEKQLNWKEAYRLIDNLVRRINQMQLERTWAFEPVGYPWGDADDAEFPQKVANKATSIFQAAGLIPRNRKIGPIDTDNQYQQLVALLQKAKGKRMDITIKARHDDPEKTDLWGLLPSDQSGERPKFLLSGNKINVLGHEWFFGKDLPAIPLDTVAVRRECYAIILEALQEGELSRFSKCPRCSRFFAAEHLNKKYCGDECMRAADNERAKRDVKKRRDDEKEKEEQRYHAAKEARKRKQFKNFCDFMKLVGKFSLPETDLDKIRPILKAIGKGDLQKGRKIVDKWETKLANGSLETVWQQLSAPEKDLFDKSTA